MTLEDIIRGRRSISAWLDTPVSEALVTELLDTAVWTPNHHLTEPWRFILLQGGGVEGWAQIHGQFAYEHMATQSDDPAIHAAAREKEYRKHLAIPARLFIVVKVSADPEVRAEDFAACCCLTQNFMLLAWERGLGTSWKSFRHGEQRLAAYLGLAADEQVVGYLNLGYPAKVPPPRPRAAAQARLTTIRATATPPGYPSFEAFRDDKRPVPPRA